MRGSVPENKINRSDCRILYVVEFWAEGKQARRRSCLMKKYGDELFIYAMALQEDKDNEQEEDEQDEDQEDEDKDEDLVEKVFIEIESIISE
jgi:hypothetical protein